MLEITLPDAAAFLRLSINDAFFHTADSFKAHMQDKMPQDVNFLSYETSLAAAS
jgi:ketopantoate hydroxymethyltransferase